MLVKLSTSTNANSIKEGLWIERIKQIFIKKFQFFKIHEKKSINPRTFFVIVW